MHLWKLKTRTKIFFAISHSSAKLSNPGLKKNVYNVLSEGQLWPIVCVVFGDHRYLHFDFLKKNNETRMFNIYLSSLQRVFFCNAACHLSHLFLLLLVRIDFNQKPQSSGYPQKE